MKSGQDKIISHIKRASSGNQWTIQTNREHCDAVAELAAEFCAKFGMPDTGYLCGILHDLGKERNSFQAYIRRKSGYDESCKSYEEHRHAYVGALASLKIFPECCVPLAFAIAGHHRGLYDWHELETVLNESTIPAEISLPDLKGRHPEIIKAEKPHDVHMILRMLFSALVDADGLDTERFMTPENFNRREKGDSVEKLLARLETHLSGLRQNSADSKVNRIRNLVQDLCRQSGEKERGIFSLTVPTGGGKTLSSVLWALRHCVANGMDGVIIAIPYTSIIEQTAETLRNIFGEANVLEHHSNINESIHNDSGTREDTESGKSANSLAIENWDRPIIVTTNVQFFESLYHHKPSKCRKLHNVANKVIILDETQTLPPPLLQPLVNALDTLNRIFRCSVLLTTASQPVLKGVIRRSAEQILVGFDNIHEIIPPDKRLHEELRRVDISFDNERTGIGELADELMRNDKALCVVNTRKIAKNLYDELKAKGEPCMIHLSRTMCGNHLKRALGMIRDTLPEAGKRLIVISTQLIEAGVDIDFPVVYRQEAGLDSVLQAAGRCNREGKLDGLGKVRVFSLDVEGSVPNGQLRYANDARKNMPYYPDVTAPEAIERFFMDFYRRCGDFDRHDMKGLLYKRKLYFESASKEFRYIESDSIPLIVNYGEASGLIERIRREGLSHSTRQALSGYIVNVNRATYSALMARGAIEEINEYCLWLWPEQFYDENVGVVIDDKWTEETIII